MKKITSKIVLTLLGLFICSLAFTQINFKRKQIDGNTYFGVTADNAKQTATLVNEKAILKQITNSNESFEFWFVSSFSDDLKFIHKKFSVFYNGIEIKGMDFVIHEKDGIIQYVNGSYENIETIVITPSINQEAAISNAKTYYEAIVKTKATTKLVVENKGFCIIKNSLLLNTNYELAYKILIDPNGVNGKYVFVSAINGKIISYENLVCNSNVPGRAQTRYSGTKDFTTDQQGTQYRLRELRNGVNIKTLNANYESNTEVIVNSATDFWDTNDNVWTVAEHGANQVATDVHWAMENFYDYWLSKHNRNSINNAGMDIISYVHVGSNYENAFWSRTRLSMFYGDGSSTFTPLTSIDVCAHEMGHGISQFTSDLTPGPFESGALNEGFSDIWAAVIEAYAAPNKQRWLIGEEIFISPAYTCIRNIQNPKTTTGFQGPDPDTYLGQNWQFGAGDPHKNSTVLSHWFYLVTEGGSGTNDIQNGYCVNAIGMDKAAAIAYRTEQLLNPSANYAMARTMSIQAAQELYGVNSLEEVSVIRAWYAVGVGNNYNGTPPPPPPPVISGPNAICPSGIYNVTGLSSNATVTWTVSNPALASLTVNGNTATVTSLVSGSSSISLDATVTGGCALVPVSGSKFISIGAPIPYNINYTNTYNNTVNPIGFLPTITNAACTGYGIITSINPPAGSTATWQKISSSNNVSWSQNQGALNFYLWGANQNVVFQIDVSNSCGTYSRQAKWVSSNCGTGGGACDAFTISPNPSTGKIKVVINNFPPPCFTQNSATADVDFKSLKIAKVNVYNVAGTIINTTMANSANQASIDLGYTTSGTHFVEIICTNGYKEKQMIFINQ